MTRRPVTIEDAMVAISRAGRTDPPTAPRPCGEPGKGTLAEVWAEYAPWGRAHHRTFRNERMNWENLLGPRFGHMQASSITLRDVDEYRAVRDATLSRRGIPPAVATVNMEISFLRRLLNFAVDRGRIQVNPIARVQLVQARNIRRTTITPVQLEAILTHSPPLLRAALLALYDTGCRRMEIFGMRWDQLNPTTGDINLGSADTKTGIPRVPRLSKRALAAIVALPKTSEWVFTNPATGKAYSPRYMYTWFEAAVAKAGIVGVNGEKVWLHTLRHSAIKNWRVWGIPDRISMRMSGHSTRSAFDRYGFPAEEEHVAAVQLAERETEKALRNMGTDGAGEP